jgi:tRNA G18 (ribose-2'-O)-methylase SpoU
MERIESIDDARVAPYRNLRDRTLRGESIFVTEGELVTLRLLGSRYPAESVFVAEKFAERLEQAVGDVPLYVGSEKLLREVVGFPFHRGVLGAGRRTGALGLDEMMAGAGMSGRCGLVVCPEVTKPDNLGLIFRSAAAFGVEGVLLGSRCCDPLSRRALRLSMGGVLQMPWVTSNDLPGHLRRLRTEWRFELWATVLDERADRLDSLCWPDRTALLLGNEFDGLEEPYLSLCDRRVTIPMRPGVDSLNLGVAAGVFLYEMKCRRRDV